MPPDDNGWDEYRKFVLSKLDDHDGLLRDIHKLQRGALIQLASLKVRASLWGLAAGSVPVFLTIAVWLLIWVLKAN